MGSPGGFIHSGILGGRVSTFSLAAKALLAARPAARTAPPTNVPPSRRKRRRDVTPGSLSTSVGSVIVRSPFESGRVEQRNEAGRHHRPATYLVNAIARSKAGQDLQRSQERNCKKRIHAWYTTYRSGHLRGENVGAMLRQTHCRRRLVRSSCVLRSKAAA